MQVEVAEYSSKKQLMLATENQTQRSLRSRKMVDIAFTNLKYSIMVDSNIPGSRTKVERTILNDLNGYCPGGSVTAILGSSGAGKTTLLNVLAARVGRSGNTTLNGQLLANGKPYDYDNFSSFASYIMQNDVLLETFTPFESFTFVASLKYADPEIRRCRVEDTIKAMRLEKCQNTKIGGVTLKGISGGEKKRTSIGYELVANPSVILLDEPTSGLDSFTAFQIINQLKQLAEEQDRTIILTIHQPSSDIYLLLDRIMLLVQGRFIYQGPREQLLSYFKSIGFPCPDHSNPMDYMLSIMHSESTQNIANYQIYFDSYANQLQQEVMKEITQGSTLEIEKKKIDTSTSYQIAIIAKRAFSNFLRDDMQLKSRIMQSIFMGLLMGGVFWKVAENEGTVSNMFSVAGAIFFTCINLTFAAVMGVILGFAVEREVYLREENSKLYTTLSYFIGKQFIEIPFCFIGPIIQQLICYWMIRFNDQEAELVPIHILLFIMLSLCANSMGLMAGCAFQDVQAAINIAPMVLMPLIIFSGFFANSKDFYVWIGWIQYLSPIKYTFEGVSTNEFVGKEYDVDPLEVYDFTIGVWECFGILVAYTIVYRMLALYFLYRLKQKLQ